MVRDCRGWGAPGTQPIGADGPHTYLVLAQNNHELRATGGFISGVGELQVEGGRLTSLTFRDSYAVDNLKVPHELAPRDLQQTLFSELWLFRDTNWDVDFPLSARRAMEVYTRDQGVQVDGVVALDLMALQLLVEATGPIHVPGIPEPVTGETVLQVIQAQWTEPIAGVGQEQGEKWRLHRKDFMGQIAGAAVDQLMTGQDVPLVTLGRAAKKALDEKHILVYSTDSHAADLLRDRNWDGALEDSLSPSDRLLIVDSNVGFNKVDPNVDRSVGYRVDLTGGGVPTARLTLGYQHLSSRPVGACVQEARYGDTYAAMMERCYWNYVRVYVPGGSHLLAEPDLPLPAGSLLAKSGDAFLAPPIRPVLTDDRWAVWTAFFDLPTLGNVTLAFDYELPASVLDQGVDGLTRYHLSVQKQPGTEAVPLKVEIALPPGAELLDAAPAGLLSRQGAELVASTDLRIDREFEIVFRREGMKP
jgi:hypothetical protein